MNIRRLAHFFLFAYTIKIYPGCNKDFFLNLTWSPDYLEIYGH